MPWHPVYQTRQTSADEWHGVDQWLGEWGVIRRLRFGGEVWYRGVTRRRPDDPWALVGYSTDMRAISKRTYLAYLHNRRTTGGINGS